MNPQHPASSVTVCIESFLPIGWRTFIWWEHQPKCCTIFVWMAGCWNSSNILLTSRYPKNICWLSRIFGARFGVKDHGLCPWTEQAGGWINFWMKRLRTFKSFQIFKTKFKKIKNLYRLMTFLRPIQWYHSHADPIWSDVTLMIACVDSYPEMEFLNGIFSGHKHESSQTQVFVYPRFLFFKMLFMNRLEFSYLAIFWKDFLKPK